MIEMMLSDVAKVVAAPAPDVDTMIRGVSIDTRSLVRDNAFVALDGRHARGVEFVADAQSRGAAAAIVSGITDVNLPQLQVDNPLLALQQLAVHWRDRWQPTVVAVTGSNGKTTMRSLIAACLGNRCLATAGNFNNHIGVPLMLMRLSSMHDRAVFELGANHVGEIAELASWVRPDIAIITNAGPAHLEGFGSIEGVARGKGELYAALKEGGIAIINADDQFAEYWRGVASHVEIVSFGSASHADCWFDQWRSHGEGQSFELHTRQGDVSIQLQLDGRHNAMNACGAAAVALAAGVDLTTIAAALADVAAEPGRQLQRIGYCGCQVFDDSYNANPASMKAAAEMLADNHDHPWMVIGDMGELGVDSLDLHRATGVAIRDAGITRLFTLGSASKEAALSFGVDAESFDDLQSLTEALKGRLHQDVTLLVKGSRSAGMERVVAALCEGADS